MLDDNDEFADEGSVLAAHEVLNYVRNIVKDWWFQETILTKGLDRKTRTHWLKKLLTENEYAINRAVKLVGLSQGEQR